MGIGLAILCSSNPLFAQSGVEDNRKYFAEIDKVTQEKEIEVMGVRQPYQQLEVRITSGDMANKKVTIENGNEPMANVIKYKVGDKVLVNLGVDLEGNQVFYISDFVRNDKLLILLIIFVGLTILVARGKGINSVISMLLTFAAIFYFVLPRISDGTDPLLVAVLFSLGIIPITFYLSHGMNKKTTAAIIGSLITLVVICGLGQVSIVITHLTGLSSEEAGMLSVEQGGLLNMPGILLAGIVIGALGVLDDITVSQAAVVSELAGGAKVTKTKELYSRAMNVGRDHITSMVNTLVLAYAGASLPLLLIFINNPHPFAEIVNYEMISEEIVRTLTGSIGLILAVPITTLIAVWMFAEKRD